MTNLSLLQFVLIGVGFVVLYVIGLFAWFVWRRDRKALDELEAVNAREAELRERLRRTQSQLDELSYDEGTAIAAVGAPIVPEVPEELVTACLEGAVLFAGAGLARQAGLPTGRELVRRMLDQLVHDEPAGGWGGLRSQVDGVDPSLLAEVLETRLDRRQLQHVLTHALREPQPSARSATLEALARIPFDAVLTTGWDKTLEYAFAGRQPLIVGPTTKPLSPILRGQQFFILRLYGSIDRPDELVLSAGRFRQVVFGNPEMTRYVASLFNTKTMLFLGATPAEIEEFLTACDIWSRPERTHFALVPSVRGTSLERERMLSRFNLLLLEYGATPGHPEVERFVRSLSSKVSVSQRRGTAERPTLRPEVLDGVVLRDIGPFTDLRLDFGHSWNVLLGDNGCGKSTILRAIALCLCGDDPRAESAAATLLRSGAAVGSIELRAGRTVYRTSLLRDGTRVRVASDYITPVQAGTSLAVGFPPLRGISIGNPSGPSDDGAPNPVVDDLLPLIDPDGLDGRLRSLKQWIVNVSVASELGKARGAGPARPAALRDTFFRIVERLVPGVPFSFHKVDERTWDVLVRTEDGIIPIDRLSQGMSSMLSWVGVLLQRLYEIHREDDRPEGRDALVLVDELDAHLHPSWQAEIVPILRDVFPHLQVVATTHSPLVVGNLRPGELQHLRRDRGPGVAVERIEQSFRGWRADQILTGPPFDMDSSRDQETKRLMQEYKRLLALPDPTDQERDRLRELSTLLASTVPSYQETEAARRAEALVEGWMIDRLGDLSDDQQQQVLQEARLYLARLQSRSPDASR